MVILKIIALSLSSLIVLFILTKLTGNREISQLTMFDYIIGITIGSIAAEMATSLEDDFLEPLTAMIVYGLASIIIAILSSKSLKIRRFITGKAKILFNDGTLYKNNFKSGKIDLNDFFMECRDKGFFNLSDIQTALLEPNGKISILPKSNKKPLTPNDMQISVKQEKLVFNLILDGNILYENLKYSGNNEKWLYKELSKQGFKDIKDIFLATCDYENNLSVYPDCSKKDRNDLFE